MVGIVGDQPRILAWHAVLAVVAFGHPIRSGSVTDTLSSAPDGARVIGKTIGVKVACNMAF